MTSRVAKFWEFSKLETLYGNICKITGWPITENLNIVELKAIYGTNSDIIV